MHLYFDVGNEILSDSCMRPRRHYGRERDAFQCYATPTGVIAVDGNYICFRPFVLERNFFFSRASCGVERL